MPKNDDDIRKQLLDTRTELLRAEIRIEFRELVAQSIDEMADALGDLSTNTAVIREKVSNLENEMKDLKDRMTRQENTILNNLFNVLFGWMGAGRGQS